MQEILLVAHGKQCFAAPILPARPIKTRQRKRGAQHDGKLAAVRRRECDMRPSRARVIYIKNCLHLAAPVSGPCPVQGRRESVPGQAGRWSGEGVPSPAASQRIPALPLVPTFQWFDHRQPAMNGCARPARSSIKTAAAWISCARQIASSSPASTSSVRFNVLGDWTVAQAGNELAHCLTSAGVFGCCSSRKTVGGITTCRKRRGRIVSAPHKMR